MFKKLGLILLALCLTTSLAFAEGNDSDTKLLLHMNGTDGSTDFPDDSFASPTHTVTAVDNAQVDTAQSQFGGASGLFDGTGDYLSIPDHADWAFGSGDFTVDFWIRRGDVDRKQVILGQRTGGGNNSWYIQINLNNTLVGRVIANSTTYSALSTGTITDSNWHHIALVRDGNTLRLFIAGGADGTDDVTGVTVNDVAAILAIGRLGELDALYFNGWAEEVRVSKGIARWTSNFSVPTEEYSEVTEVGQFIMIR